MTTPPVLEAVRTKFELLRPLMTERLRRQWAACEAQLLGRGGVAAVAEATGLSRTTLWAGLKELRQRADQPQQDLHPERVRLPGAGRPFLGDTDPTLVRDLEALVEPTTRGDPQTPLRWTCKSTRKLAEELQRRGHHVSHQTVAALLHDLDYSLQANRKTREGASHPDRNAQFEHLNAKVKWSLSRKEPVISVDTKKKELVGDFKNGGRELRPKGDPEKVRVHDFIDKDLGRATPYGIYDIGRNSGWVSGGVDHDTAEFAVQSIRR